MIFTAEEKDTGTRLDTFISDNTELSRSAAARLIEQGHVTVCGASVPKKYALKSGDEIEIAMPEP